MNCLIWLLWKDIIVKLFNEYKHNFLGSCVWTEIIAKQYILKIHFYLKFE